VSVAGGAEREVVAPSWRSPMQPMGRAVGLGERPGGRGAPFAAGVTDGQRGCLGIGGAQPGGIGVDGLDLRRWKRDPALAGHTPAAFMSPTIAQHHTGFLDSRATASRDGVELLREV